MSALKSYGASILAAITSLGALDASKFLPFLPPDVAHWVVVFFAACAAITHFITAVSKSTEAKTATQNVATLLLLAAITTLSFAMTSCSQPWAFTSPYGSVVNTSSGATYVPPVNPVRISGK